MTKTTLTLIFLLATTLGLPGTASAQRPHVDLSVSIGGGHESHQVSHLDASYGGHATYNGGHATYNGGHASYNGGHTTYNRGHATYNRGHATYNGGHATYNGGPATYNGGHANPGAPHFNSRTDSVGRHGGGH